MEVLLHIFGSGDSNKCFSGIFWGAVFRGIGFWPLSGLKNRPHNIFLLVRLLVGSVLEAAWRLLIKTEGATAPRTALVET